MIPSRPRSAKFALAQIVRHRDRAFRGVVIDVDAAYAGSPSDLTVEAADQPYYRVLALGPEGGFIAYAAEDVLEHDPEVMGLSRLEEQRWFTIDRDGRHAPKSQGLH